MILLSIYLGLITYKDINYFDYLKKRIMRLVLPTWIFVIIFFIISYFSGIYNISIKSFVGTMALSDVGIGYVWVVRIYFLIALLIPIFKAIQKKLNDNYIILLSIILFILYEILCACGFFNSFILQYLIAYIIPCFLLVSLSYEIFVRQNHFWVLLVSVIIFFVNFIILYITNGFFQPTQIMKYPFRSYYLSYGIICSIILFYLFRKIKQNSKIITFISNNSLWLYLIHILFIYISNIFINEWYYKTIFVIVVSVIVVFVKNIIIKKIEYNNNYKFLKVFKG